MENILKKIKQLKVLIIGDIMLDHYIMGDITRISPEAPVPVISIEKEHYTLGAAANVALNISQLGAKASLWGIWGKDEAGKKIKGLLSKANIITLPQPTDKAQTIVKTRLIARNQQICRLDREAEKHLYQLPLAEAEYKDRLNKAITDADAIILSDYAKGVITEPLIQSVQKIAQQKEKFLAIDPKPKSDLHYSDFDLITPNKDESYLLAGLPISHQKLYPGEQICKKINQCFKPKTLIITLGKEGLLISKKGKIIQQIPTYAHEVFDVSGAGDTTISALTLALAAKFPVEQAAYFANTAAGVVVGKPGTATVTPQEMIDYHHAHIKDTSFS